MSAVLHIGTEKTGTKSIQAFLAVNRRRLGEQGVVFTKSLGAENNRDLATYAIRDTEFNEDALVTLGIKDAAARAVFRAGVEARLHRELEGIAADSRLVIFSSEHLQSRLKSPREIQTLKTLLAGSGLQVTRVIVYLRDPAEIIWSLYSTALRNGSTEPPPTAPSRPHWNHICDHKNTMLLWGDAFGRDIVVPRLFEFDWQASRELLLDFASTAMIDPNGLELPSPSNRGLTASGQSLLRGLNIRLALRGSESGLPARLRMVKAISDRFSGTPAPVPDGLRTTCAVEFAESNEWVRERYFPGAATLFGAGGSTTADGGDASSTPTVDDALDTFADYWQIERRAHVDDGS